MVLGIAFIRQKSSILGGAAPFDYTQGAALLKVQRPDIPQKASYFVKALCCPVNHAK
jgi:hypothetical protein